MKIRDRIREIEETEDVDEAHQIGDEIDYRVEDEEMEEEIKRFGEEVIHRRVRAMDYFLTTLE